MHTMGGGTRARSPPPGSCQVNRSGQELTLAGTVRDQSGAVVTSARVVARCGELDRETETREDGSYSLRVPAAYLTVQVSRAGFETVSRNIEPGTLNPHPEDVVLPVAHAVANVSVNASEGYVAQSSASAIKMDALIRDTPQSISVVTSEQLEQRGVQTLNEALRFTPGVAVECFGVDPRYDSFLIRGFGDSTNALFIDGIRFPGHLGQTDPYMAENVTVLKGPSSVLYGQSAPGGLVNITSKRPPDHSSREVQVDFGSYDRKQVSGDFGRLFDSHWRYRLAALYRDSGTQINYSPDDRWLVMPAITWARTEKTSLTLLSFYQRDHSGWAQFLPAQGTLLANPYGTIPVNFFTGVPGFDGVHRAQWSAGYIFDHRFNRTGTFHQAFRAYNVRYDGATAYGIGLEPDLRTLNRSAYTFRDTDTIYAVDNRGRQTSARASSAMLCWWVTIFPAPAITREERSLQCRYRYLRATIQHRSARADVLFE
jgi:iron complex outermembrane receptor protein